MTLRCCTSAVTVYNAKEAVVRYSRRIDHRTSSVDPLTHTHSKWFVLYDGGFENTVRAVFAQQNFNEMVDTVASAAWESPLISLCCKSA